MTAIELTIPGAQRLALNANDRLHWAAKHAKTTYWKNLAWSVTRNLINDVVSNDLDVPLQGRTRIVVTVSWPDKRRRDVGNLAPTCKALVDGIVLAGLLVDDSDRYVLGPDIRRGYGPWGVTVRLEPATDGGDAA